MSFFFLQGIVQSQSDGVNPPTLEEKENWFYGTGNVDNSAVPRRDVQQMISDATGLDTSEILYSSSLADDLALTRFDPETDSLITAFETGFPQVDWASYSETLNSWDDFFSDDFNGILVEDICYIWADAENREMLILS